MPPHLISTPDSNPKRPILEREGQELSAFSGELNSEQYRARVNELYSIVVYDNKRPIFEENDPVQPIFAAAVDMLDKYILNAWHGNSAGEYETVHAIHDWLIAYTEYDFALYDMYRNGSADLSGNPAFYIDGVFLNGRAVCDGLSRAFNFLCAIEGIQSIRVTGSFASSPHAWNKCKVGDKWYNVDVTSDAAYYNTSGGGNSKQLTHGYFMLSDSTLKSFKPNGHVFEAQPYSADEDYDYYSNTTVTVGGKAYSAVIKSQAELNNLFEAISDCDGSVGKIELKLDFIGKTQVNTIDMYSSEIAVAYSKLDGADFDISATNKPYFRYPNGVYLFLMYK